MKKWFLLISISLCLLIVLISKQKTSSQDQSTFRINHFFKNSENFTSGKINFFPDRSEFNPESNSNFAFLIWVKFKELPKIDQRVFVLRKFDESSNWGYALAFNQINEGFYPQIFWSNKNPTNWLTFQKFKFQTNRWYGFLVTYTENKYLGLHLLKPQKNSNLEVENLGGYALPDTFPVTNTQLELGSTGTKLFKGAIANVSFFKISEDKFNLIDFISEIKESNPGKHLPSYPSYNLPNSEGKPKL